MIVAIVPGTLIVALALLAESPGPLFFRQARYGFRGRQFQMLKFRSMVVDAEERKAQLMSQNEADGPIFKIRNDPRVTRIGRFIRKYSIDELPQLIHVLLGDMSLVGPRPLPIKEVDLCSDHEWKRYLVKPGMLCYREVNGRSKLTHAEWIASDLQYIRDRSMATDLRILIKAVGAVLTHDGAY